MKWTLRIAFSEGALVTCHVWSAVADGMLSACVPKAFFFHQMLALQRLDCRPLEIDADNCVVTSQ
jgi:hypothetical protein